MRKNASFDSTIGFLALGVTIAFEALPRFSFPYMRP